jgi:biotin synthase
MHPALAAARHTLLTLRRPLGREELTAVSDVPDADVEALLELASDVRDHFCGARAYVEVIYNAKKGGCSEDCHFCSQSARFATDVDPEPLRTVDDFVAAARAALERGAGEFCIVVAVRGPSNTLLARVAEAVRAIKATMPLEVAVSLGILTEAHLEILARAGVDKVNHNLESSRRFFPSVCTTHSYDERFETCLRVKRAGLELCCGGIIGMGETDADRIDFLCALQELEPAEVPINFLDPRPGTPFADRSVMEPMAALRYVALARLALPRALIRFAGGREITLRGLQDLGMQSGASGLILGNYLTTKGREDREDFAMLDRLGFEVMR